MGEQNIIYMQEDQWERVLKILQRYRVRCMQTERELLDDLVEGIEAQSIIEFDLDED
jgi:hypothetical protein